MKRVIGFTLLEVLAALMLLGFLLVGIYTGIHATMRTVRSGQKHTLRFNQVRTAQHFLRSELEQALAWPVAHNDKGEPLFFIGSASEIRFVAPLPGYLAHLGPQLLHIVLVPDKAGTMRLEVSFATLSPDGSAPQPVGDTQILLKGIDSGVFQYFDRGPERNPDGSQNQEKSSGWQATWENRQQLPGLVSVRLKLKHGTDWPLLNVPLRLTSQRHNAMRSR